MRKVDKRCQVEGFQAWYESNPNRKYNSSNGKYYYQIVQNLFFDQKGVCAFTERRLCPEKNYIDFPSATVIDSSGFEGNLDHFDSSLKETNGWQWENLLMVHSDTNRRKSTGEVDYILKPDGDSYDPFHLMKYDFSNHLFFPNTETLSIAEQERVKKMILILGINHDSVVDDREKYFSRDIEKIEFELSTWEEFESHVDRFFTAFAMIRRHYESTAI